MVDCLVSENSTEVVKGKARDFLVWADKEVELLLKLTYEYMVVKAVEITDWESWKSKYIEILEQCWEPYPLLEEATAMGKEHPYRKDKITKGM